MSLPNLPGYTFYNPRKTDYRKGQFFNVQAGLMGQKKDAPEKIETSALQVTMNRSITAPPKQPVATFPDYIPAHVAYDHVVLRYYAYFKQEVPESPDEIFRVRYVRIHIYLEDDTIMIEESNLRNAGLPQGVLLKRMKVLRPHTTDPNCTYVLEDFRVGIDVDIFGTVYHIYAADEFTVEYLESNGLVVGEFENPPDDLYTIKRRFTDRPIRVTYVNTDKTNLRRFLESDGKVLRFYTLWDDRGTLFGERRKFIMHYFLVDGTIEIRQVLPINSGREQVSQFLKKTLIKNPETNSSYTEADLRIGTTVDVFGRKFLLYDADEFTKSFIDNKFGKQNWTPIAVDSDSTTSVSASKDLPPYNGWGSEEDSVGFCLSLHPKPPRKDVVKLVQKEGQAIRLLAKFKNPQPQDSRREFIITFYLSDDTVAVFERPKRNSGFREGKFIQRSKLKNEAAGGRYFTASDFVLGAVIVINSFTFQTIEADEFALSYMESQADDFPESDLFNLITDIRRRPDDVKRLRDAFTQYDVDPTGYIRSVDAEKVLIDTLRLTKQQARTIVRRWESRMGFDYFSLMSVIV